MPTYTFICTKCNHIFELFRTFKQYDEGGFKCEQCGSSKVLRDYQNDATGVEMSVRKGDGELKTLGDLANRNRDRMSSDQKAELNRKHNEYKAPVQKKELPKGMTRMKKSSGKFQWPK